MSQATSLASLDGEITAAAEAMVPATDEGLLRGDGVFEVIRVYDGKPFALEQHFARLQRSADNLRLEIDLEAVRAETHRLLAQDEAGPNDGALRIVLTRGGRRLLLTEPLHELPDRIRLATVTYSPTRVLDGIKSLSYASNMLSRQARAGARSRRRAARHPARARARSADSIDLLGRGRAHQDAAARRPHPRVDHPCARDRHLRRDRAASARSMT